MPAIRSTAEIAAKWQRKAPLSTADYESGVRTTQADWATLTTQAAANYTAGLQAAMAAKRWEGGVAATGTAGWKERTLAKGPARWAEGIDKSGDAYARGFGPYADVIRATTLSPRGPRGAQQNYQRSQLMGQALNRARVGK